MVNFSNAVTFCLTLVGTALAVPHTISQRSVSCLDHDADSKTFGAIKEAEECIKHLSTLKNRECRSSSTPTVFCKRGKTEITGQAVGLPRWMTTATTCDDVARGAQWILDTCARNDGSIRGQDPAWGNGYLMVNIRSVE
ncbi:hypothetical protein FLONG3_3595 [Fusarium longipes]|uniref:Uncharacterized protein n=1 Tax=Fusarium longipes TaxID=694270 RepID=A0A395T0S6_9HYPO|nr:hypothetical protein FLONG3_3595 [Fusarium longipes]